MISRNKGIFSLGFLFPILAFIVSLVVVRIFYAYYVEPRADESERKRRLIVQTGNAEILDSRTLHDIIKDRESEIEIVFCLWGLAILGYKLGHVTRERRLFKYDFLRVQPGERIIPEDALDRYKEMKTAVERNPQWHERLLPECLLAALHRFHATSSIQDSTNAVKERADLAGDELDSSLALVRYIAWAIPAFGFIGTVRGIGDALNHAEAAVNGDISEITSSLSLAFNTTFVGLTLCIVLMFVLHIVQERQEAFIIETQTFCRDKLIDVMKVPNKEDSHPTFT